ncbi:hypothetical protein V8F33_006488 [Rhypophila sp. PSN 637]
MKLATLSTTLLACALTLVSAAALPEAAQNPDGAYAGHLDEFIGGGKQRSSCLRSGARSFVCSYAGIGPTIKYQGDLKRTWDSIKKKCPGTGRLGHDEIPGGYGLVSAGYTYDGDHCCWE